MNVKKWILVGVFASWLMFPLSAQDSVMQFSVNEAREYAVKHNRELQNAKKDVHIAEEQYKAARGQGLPQVSGKLDYMTNFNYEAELNFGSDDESSTPDLDYTLFDQGDFEILKLLESMSSSGPTTIKMTDQSNAQLQVSQLIFGGQYWVGLKTANIARELARQNVTLTELDVKESIENTYYMILITEKILDVLNKNIDNLDDIKEHTKNMYQAGLAEEVDVDQISISQSQLENQKRAMERNVRLTYHMLHFQMGLDYDQEIELTDSLDALMENLEISTKLATSFDPAQHPQYQLLETQQKLQEKQIDMKKWAYGPTITGFYTYTEKIMISGFDLNPRNAAGLNLSIPIFSSGVRKANLDKAKIELDKAKRTKEMVKEQLLMQNNQLRFDLTNAFENYQTQKENVKVAKRVLDNIENKYKHGLASSLDLTQANSNYLEAESNYLNAAMELMQANLKLEKLYNQL
ncbi:MAG: TolC family protein [Candidatus Delongbacteria bacterium]|jgi:outer membrane protein|nr:TolC family protein [Candidatus Delongbacteria bacterium]